MHFSVLVILKKGQNLEQVMEPFNEQAAGEERDEKCYCVSSAARRAVSQLLDFQHDVKELYDKLPKAERTRQHWREMVQAHRDKEVAMLKAHPLFGKADKTCTECKGHGLTKTTSNPNGHWDWYEEGGRWDGSLSNKKGKSVNRLKVKDFSFEQMELQAHRRLTEAWDEIQKTLVAEPEKEQLLEMTHSYEGEKTFQEYSVKHMPDSISAYAFVADGEWLAHERFDHELMTHSEIEGWQEKLNAKIKAAGPDDELVYVDCHN